MRDVLNGEHAKTKFALWASEVIFDSEVHFVSEVSPIGEVANLTSLVRSTNFTVLRTTSLLPKAKTSPIPYVHISGEYKAKSL